MPDIDKARELLGYRPQVDLEEGLLRTIYWYRAASHERMSADAPMSDVVDARRRAGQEFRLGLLAQAVARGRARSRFEVRARRDLRLPRAQRRGQDHHASRC